VRLQGKGRWAWLTALFICPALAQPVPEKVPLCNACHGEGGNSVLPGTPSLAGQPVLFVENQLVLIREGVRKVLPVMESAVQGMKDAEIRALGEEYLEAAMNAYRNYTRTGGDTLMAAALYGTTDADVRALAHYLAKQKP